MKLEMVCLYTVRDDQFILSKRWLSLGTLLQVVKVEGVMLQVVKLTVSKCFSVKLTFDT